MSDFAETAYQNFIARTRGDRGFKEQTEKAAFIAEFNNYKDNILTIVHHEAVVAQLDWDRRLVHVLNHIANRIEYYNE